MKVTLKQIADIAGVSRGTVDRALHGRGGVNPQVQEQILAVARELGYRPNIAGRQLSARKLSLKFGFILPKWSATGFWADVHRGIDLVCEELADYGVKIIRETYVKYAASEVLPLIDRLLDEGISGLAIVPINDPAVQARLNELIAGDFPVVLVNSEAEGVEPLCYIGSDYQFSGRTAAGILDLIRKDQYIELLVFTGTEAMLSHTWRITGFLQEMSRIHPECHLIDIYKLFSKTNTPDDHGAYLIARDTLEKHPEATAVFTAAGAIHSVAQAIRDTGRIGRVAHISFDMNSVTHALLQDGSMTAIIGQESVKQGYQPIKVLFDYLVNKIPPLNRRIILRNEIFIRQNSSMDDSSYL